MFHFHIFSLYLSCTLIRHFQWSLGHMIQSTRFNTKYGPSTSMCNLYNIHPFFIIHETVLLDTSAEPAWRLCSIPFIFMQASHWVPWA